LKEVIGKRKGYETAVYFGRESQKSIASNVSSRLFTEVLISFMHLILDPFQITFLLLNGVGILQILLCVFIFHFLNHSQHVLLSGMGTSNVPSHLRKNRKCMDK
jgi:hypothetical protein